MTKESFELLLSDLYDVFNPSKKSEIPNLLTKYNGREFDAVYHMIFKYNYPKSSHYNPAIGTPENVKLLIEEYSNNKRIVHSLLNKEMPDAELILKKQINNAQGAIEQTAIDFKQTVFEIHEERQKEFDKIYNNRMKELKDFFDNINKMSVKAASNTEVRLNILWTEKELIIPQELYNSSIGTRFLIYDKDNGFHGIEIKDITMDYISNSEMCIKEITIDKV